MWRKWRNLARKISGRRIFPWILEQTVQIDFSTLLLRWFEFCTYLHHFVVGPVWSPLWIRYVNDSLQVFAEFHCSRWWGACMAMKRRREECCKWPVRARTLLLVHCYAVRCVWFVLVFFSSWFSWRCVDDFSENVLSIWIYRRVVFSRASYSCTECRILRSKLFCLRHNLNVRFSRNWVPFMCFNIWRQILVIVCEVSASWKSSS